MQDYTYLECFSIGMKGGSYLTTMLWFIAKQEAFDIAFYLTLIGDQSAIWIKKDGNEIGNIFGDWQYFLSGN